MRTAGLHAIATVIPTQAVLISKKKSSRPDLVQKITSRIRGVIAAQKYVLLNYNIERRNLQTAVTITPGRQAPTISPLEKSDWAEVQSMVLKERVAEIMDELEAAGATDILVFAIDNCRV
jgi:ATP phosphoribosyltransferase